MKNLAFILSISIFLLLGCEKACDCTYYSEEKVGTGPWKITYESDWDYCEEEDFGTSTYYGTNATYYTHTYVKCR